MYTNMKTKDQLFNIQRAAHDLMIQYNMAPCAPGTLNDIPSYAAGMRDMLMLVLGREHQPGCQDPLATLTFYLVERHMPDNVVPMPTMEDE